MEILFKNGSKIETIDSENSVRSRQSGHILFDYDSIEVEEYFMGIKLFPYQKILIKFYIYIYIYIERENNKMGEWDPFKITPMDKEVLDVFLKYGLGCMKMYDKARFC